MDIHLKTVERLARLMDNEFRIFGFRFGLDPLIGLFPGFGDGITLLLSAYMIWIGVNLNMPGDKVLKMLANVGIDFLLGLVPVLGDAGDFFFKASHRNYEILKEHIYQLNPNIIDGEVA
jgi:hypothetical protein